MTFSPTEREGAKILAFVRTADIYGYKVKSAKVRARYFDGLAAMCASCGISRKDIVFCGVKLVRLPAPVEMFWAARFEFNHTRRCTSEYGYSSGT